MLGEERRDAGGQRRNVQALLLKPQLRTGACIKSLLSLNGFNRGASERGRSRMARFRSGRFGTIAFTFLVSLSRILEGVGVLGQREQGRSSGWERGSGLGERGKL